MTVITNRVQVQKKYWEAPLNERRHFSVYRWDSAISTADTEYINGVPLKYGSDTVISQKPTEKALVTFATDDGETAASYYLCEFHMSDFGLKKKVSTDLCADETGKDYFIEPSVSQYYANCENPLALEEDQEPLMYIEKLSNGTFHLNVGYELLAELEERGYDGTVWAVVADAN